MSERKFELFMCCLGNGTTVCNKAVLENGDYKIIAHISDFGKVKFRVPAGYIPNDAMEKIKAVAKADRQKFLTEWNKKTVCKKYEIVMDKLPMNDFLRLVKDKCLTMEEKVSRAERILFELY